MKNVSKNQLLEVVGGRIDHRAGGGVSGGNAGGASGSANKVVSHYASETAKKIITKPRQVTPSKYGCVGGAH
jgi:hypothetical protein